MSTETRKEGNSWQWAVQKDDNTLITTSDGDVLLERDMKTGEVVNSRGIIASVSLLTKTSNKNFLCVMKNGSIEVRSLQSLNLLHRVILSFRPSAVCGLEDCSFVVGGASGELQRWNYKGVLTTKYYGHSRLINEIIEFSHSGVIVSSSVRETVKMWNPSGECFCTVSLGCHIAALARLTEDKFAMGLPNKSLRVWNDRGSCVQDINTDYCIQGMKKLGDSLVVFSKDRIEVWRLK